MSKHIMLEDGIYKVSDREYKKIFKLGKDFLESLDYDGVKTLMESSNAKYIGDVFMNFRF